LARIDPGTKKRIRGAILRLLYMKHEGQEHRYDTRSLLFALDDLSYRVFDNLVDELVQDLGDRGYVKYKTFEVPKTGETISIEIYLTPAGRNIVEGLASDPAVDV